MLHTVHDKEEADFVIEMNNLNEGSEMSIESTTIKKTYSVSDEEESNGSNTNQKVDNFKE